MATKAATIHLSSSKELTQLFTYLNVGISKFEQDFLFTKLLNSTESNDLALDAFKIFSAIEISKFIHNDYKEQWFNTRKIYETFTIDDSDGAASLIRQQVEYSSKLETDYLEHLEKFKHGDVDAVNSINTALLKYKVNLFNQKQQPRLNQVDAEREFLKYEKSIFKKQFETLDKLYKVIGRVEGVCLSGAEGSSKQHFKKADYSRWAQYLAHDKDDRTVEAITKLKIGLTRSERIEKVEYYTQMAGMVLRILSVALALSAGDFSKAFSETGKDVLEQSHMATESTSLLVTGIVLMLKGETKLGLTYIGIATTMLAAQIATSLSEFGLHMFSVAASTMLLSFVSAACCFAMAGLSQYHISKSTKKIDILSKRSLEIEDELQASRQIADLNTQKSQLLPFKNIEEQIQLWVKQGEFQQQNKVLNDQKDIKVEALSKLKNLKLQKTISRDDLLVFLKQSQQSLALKQQEISKLTEQLDGSQSVEMESAFFITKSERGRLSDKLDLLEKNFSSEQELYDVNQALLGQTNLQLESFDFDLSSIQVDIDELNNKIDGVGSKRKKFHQDNRLDIANLNNIVVLREQQEKHLKIDSKLQPLQVSYSALNDKQVKELQQERIQFEKILLHEKAQKADLKTSRNLWVASGVALIAAGAIAAFGLSAATFGILPLVVAAIGIGLGVLKYKTSGKNSHVEKLKQSQGELELFVDLIKNKASLAMAGIDLNKEVKVKCGIFNRSIKTNLQDYLRDLIIHNPGKAKNVLEKLNEFKDANTPQEKNAAVVKLEDAMGEHKNSKLDTISCQKSQTRGLKLLNSLLDRNYEVDRDEDGDGEHQQPSLNT